MEPREPRLVLASRSPVRRAMLQEAGLEVVVVASDFDEEAHKPQLRHLPASKQALALARGKASSVSAAQPHAYVIGADQLCICDGQVFDKPGSLGQAKAHLRALQGRCHSQYSAACIYYNQRCLWEGVEPVQLTMRPLDEHAIDVYVTRDRPLDACGGYRYEAHGHSLFAHVEGTAEAIQGLPLQPLLQALARIRKREIPGA